MTNTNNLEGSIAQVLRSVMPNLQEIAKEEGVPAAEFKNFVMDRAKKALPGTFFEMMLDFRCWPDRMKFGVLVVSTMDGRDKYETLFFVSESECQPFIDRSVRHLGEGVIAAYYVYSRGKQRPEFMRAEIT